MTGRLLLGSRALADWILDGGRLPRRHFRDSARLRWHAYWFEHNWQTQAGRVAGAPLPRDPVFILGLWRSGTTALHELLAACAPWTTPRTWQCFQPSTCFLTGPPARWAVAPRPMDQGRIETQTPQEDEFATLLLGEPSAYRGFIDPRRLRQCGERLWAGGEGQLDRWQDFLRGLVAQAPASRLLLKSPNHTFRLPLLTSLFPAARFVWIGRHTGEVLASNARMWRAMMEVYGLWDCPPGVLEGFLEDMVRAGAAVLARALEEMPQERMLWVDFTELRARPRETLLEILGFVGLDPTDVDHALARLPIHAGSRSSLPADSSVRELESLMAAARKRFGSSKPL
ncbi:MAG TPA: sulfotransferase [Steroidobacteraceae bacterium]|nr:sulfotransferase [Steroidobacteraceae bacterium]